MKQEKNINITDVQITKLRASDYNPRHWSTTHIKNLTESIKRFGLVDPIIANSASNRKNVVIGGHFRLKIAKDLGYSSVPVVYLNIPDIEKEKELNLRLNRNTGEWDFELLQNMDLDMLLDVGFDESDLSQIWDEHLETEDDNFDAEEEAKKIKETDIKPGDMFELGSHRLICGSSTELDTVKRLLGNDKVSMIYSDPPYNIGLDYNKGLSGKDKYGGKTNDNKSITDYENFITQTISNGLAVSCKELHIFYYCDQKYIGLIQSIYEKLNIQNQRVCMWIKNGFNATPKNAFNKCYEPCVYGTMGKPYLAKDIKNLNEIMNKEIATGNRTIDDILDLLDIWMVKRLPGQEYEHPTQKPPTLHEKALRRCTKPGDIVLDLFGGSGSTLLACEQLKRKARLVEIEPIFCQVIINRFEKYAVTKARKIN